MNREQKLITNNENLENNNIVPIFETRALSENRNTLGSSLRSRRMRRMNNENSNNSQSEVSENNLLNNDIDSSNISHNETLIEPLVPENIETEISDTQSNSEPLVDTTNNEMPEPEIETDQVIPANINPISLIDVDRILDDSSAISSNSMRPNIAQSENEISSAVNFIELAQNQNRWVLFGLGVAFILVASFSYWIGYRRGFHIGRDNLTTILPNNRLDFRINQDSISSTNDEHKKRILKTLWNLIVDRFKFKK